MWTVRSRVRRAVLVPLVAGCLLPLAAAPTPATAAPATAAPTSALATAAPTSALATAAPAGAPAAGAATAGATLAAAGRPAQPAAGAAGAARVRGTGLRPPATRVPAARGLHQARQLGAVRVAAESVPAAVDLTPYAASPGDQGAVGSCVGWATGYTLLGWYANYQRHVGAPFAPMYVYAQINGGRDAGATIPSAWNILESQGVAEQSVYTQGNYDWWTRPTLAQTANAAPHKTRSHTYLFAGDNQGASARAAMQAALASGQPIVIGIPVHSGFGGLSPTRQVWRLADTAGKSLLGYHALVALGYDSTGLRIENSWGTSWGAAGFATLGWDFVNRYAIEASVGTGFNTANPPAAAISVPAGSLASPLGGTALAVAGTGFGSTAAQFTANKITATVNARTARVSWVSDTELAVVAPAGTPGAEVAVRVVRSGLASQPDRTARYAALITGSSQPAGPTRGGWLTTLTGVGFANSGGWALVDSAGTVVATLPVVATREALAAASSGVLLGAGAQATVKAPVAPGGRAAGYGLTFTPDQTAYPGAVVGRTSRSYLLYADLG
jgi:hypothetical protein